MEWETIDDYHTRSKVPGGWIVKAIEPTFCVALMHGLAPKNWFSSGPKHLVPHERDYRISMCFVPDPHNKWAEL